MARPPVMSQLVDPLAIDPQQVALVVAAVGYEPRCTALVSRLQQAWRCSPETLGKRMLLLEFDSQRDLPARRAADAFFEECRPAYRVAVTKDSWLEVMNAVSRVLKGSSLPGTVLVDYSCMSRLLYLSMVQLVYDGVEFVFSYSIGRYDGFELEYPISAVGTVKPVPGFEGIHYHSRPSLHVIGLGYDGIGTLALVDRLEASRLIVFWADPGASENAARIAQSQNESLVKKALVTFSRDIRDVPGTAMVLNRLAFEVAATERVVFVPVGPKPQILACALAAAPFDHCSVLAPYLGSGGIRDRFPKVEWAGTFVGTRVQAERRRR